MSKSYRRITSAPDLKELHLAAKAEGKNAVGLSKGNILYVWDEVSDNLRTVSTEEAARRLGLTVKQVDQIITSGGEVIFEKEKPAAVEPEPIDEPRFFEIETPVVAPVEEVSADNPNVADETVVAEENEANDEVDEFEDLPEEETVDETDMWKRIEDIVSELVNEKLDETKEEIKDGVKAVLDQAIDALTRIRESLE